MSLKEKILNSSKSHVYYKSNYEKLKKENNSFKKKIKSQDKKIKSKDQKIKAKNKKIKAKDKKIKSKEKKINSLKSNLEDKDKKIEFQENELLTKTNRILELENDKNEYERMVLAFEKRLEKFSESKIDNDKNVNIAYVLTAFPNHSETFIVNEVKWLKEHDYNVVVFSKEDPYKPVEIDFSVDIKRFDNEVDLMELLVEYDIDLMHTHFVHPVCTNFTFPVAEKLKIPFTVFAHAFDIFVSHIAEMNRIDEISESEYCKAIFTLSEFHKNYLIERNVKEEKIVITKQATDYEIVPIQKKSNKVKKIVSISRFVEKKGLDTLINAAKLLENEDFEFSIYGFGFLEEDLINQIENLNCKNISIKGDLPPNEVQNVLMNSDLLVSPCKISKNGDMDGIPTIIFESFAAGLPVLSTYVSAIPEIIKDCENGFIIEPDNPKLLAEKIKEISKISNEELFDIRKKAQDDVIKLTSVEKTIQKYIDTVFD